MSSSRPFTFDRVVRIIGVAAFVVGAVWLINLLRNVLLPFCLACLIAYLLEPLVELNGRLLHLRRRVPVIFITLAEVALIAGLLGYFFIPSVIREIEVLARMIHENSVPGRSVPFVPQKVVDFVTGYINSVQIDELLTGSRLEQILDTGSSVISSTLDFLFHTLEWLLTFIYVVFILIDYEPLMKGFRFLVPPKYRKVAFKVGADIKESMNRYFRGQALIALCAAVFYCIGFSIVGIPLAIVLGITVGVLYMIPYFQYVTLIPVTIVCLLDSMGGGVQFWPELGQCILVYAISQSICDYVLTPKIMGKAMGLNPAIILLSLSVWGTLLGLIGMIIALPMTTLLLAYYREYIIEPQLARQKSVSQRKSV